jgi:hypothetical protein
MDCLVSPESVMIFRRRRSTSAARDLILSINDTAGAREVFGRFAIEEVPRPRP